MIWLREALVWLVAAMAVLAAIWLTLRLGRCVAREALRGVAMLRGGESQCSKSHMRRTSRTSASARY